jgi:hypothetical protein
VLSALYADSGRGSLDDVRDIEDADTAAEGSPTLLVLAAALRFRHEYARGVIEGWDGEDGGGGPDYARGIEDGRAAWAACRSMAEGGTP